MAGMALVPRAQETFSKSAVEAIKRLQDDKKSLRQDNDKVSGVHVIMISSSPGANLWCGFVACPNAAFRPFRS